MSRSYKQPILRDRTGASNKKMYERKYRAKVSNYMFTHFKSYINTIIGYDNLDSLIEISTKTIPTRDEAFNRWDVCDYSLDYRPQCYCFSKNSRCYKFPRLPYYMFEDYVEDICKECRKKLSRK